MKSTIWASTASEALKDTALRTVTSSLSPLRPRSWAMLRMRAAASLVTFSWRVPPMSPPVADTGDAAPMLVPGAIAAKLAAAKMNVPADAARAPLGATYTATGTLAASRRWTILRVASYMPPGVSSWMTKSAACSCSAWLTVWAINPCVTWSMLRLTVMKRIVVGADWLAGSRSRPAVVITPQARIRMPSQARRTTTMLTPHPGRLEEGPPVAAMIDCSPPLVNRSDGAPPSFEPATFDGMKALPSAHGEVTVCVGPHSAAAGREGGATDGIYRVRYPQALHAGIGGPAGRSARPRTTHRARARGAPAVSRAM